MNKEIKTEIAVGVIVILALLIGGTFWLLDRKIEVKEMVCPMDVFTCPDGTEVVRSGSNCEFDCSQHLSNPITSSTESSNSLSFGCPEDVKVCSDGSTVVKTGDNCEFEKCPSPIVYDSKQIGWKTYENNLVGFSIDYPEEWGPVENEVSREAISGSGREFYILFAEKNFSIWANTEDFLPWGPIPSYTGGDPMKFCKNFQKDESTISMNGCERINENIVAVTFGNYSDVAGLILSREAFIMNKSNEYNGITIQYNFDSGDVIDVDTDPNKREDIIRDQLGKIDKEVVSKFNQIIESFDYLNN